LEQRFIDFPGIFRVIYVVVHVLRNPSFNLDVLMGNGKGKVHPRKAMKVSALEGGKWSTPRPGRFTPWKETLYPLYRRLGGAQGGLDGYGKSRLHRDSIPGTSIS